MRFRREQYQHGAQHHEGGEHQNAAVGALRGLLHPTDDGRAEEPGQIAQRVDQRNACRRRGAREEGVGQRPEQRQHHHDAHGRQRQRHHRQRGVGAPQRGERQAHGADQRGNGHVPAALMAFVRAAAHQNHRHHRHAVRQRDKPADGQRIGHAGGLDQQRQPEAQAVQADDHGEVDQRHQPHARIGHALQRRVRRLGLRLLVERVLQRVFLVRVQPLGMLDAIVEIEQGDDAQHHGRQAFEHEQPLPPGPAVMAVEVVQDPARHRPADQAGQRHRAHEPGGHLAAPRRRIPISEIEDDARKEPGLGHAEQKPHHIELRRRGDEQRERGNQPPGDHDAGDPHPRANPVKNEVARHLEQKIAEKKDARAEPVHRIGKPEVALHLQLGEANVHPVEIGDEIAQDQEGNDAPADAAIDRFGWRGCGRCRMCCHGKSPCRRSSNMRAHEKTPGRPKFSHPPSGGLTLRGRSGGTPLYPLNPVQSRDQRVINAAFHPPSRQPSRRLAPRAAPCAATHPPRAQSTSARPALHTAAG